MVLVFSALFTQQAINDFFTDSDHMNLLVRTSDQMAVEGIVSPAELHGFEKAYLTSMVHAFERPLRVVNAAGNTVNQDPFQFPGKYQKRVLIVMEMAAHYKKTNQVVTHPMMTWPTLKSFSIHMTALSKSDTHADIVPIK